MGNKEDQEYLLFFPLSHIPYLLGVCYFLGFIVIALRLERYGITPTDLFEAQYFSAGFVPAAVFFIIYWAIRLTWKPGDISEKVRGFTERIHMRVFIVAGLMIAIPWFFNARIASNDLFLRIYLCLVLVYAVYALGVLSYHTRKTYENPGHLQNVFNRNLGGHRHLRLFIFVFSMVLIYLMVPLINSSAIKFYTEIPQSFGGGEINTVKLVLEKRFVPVDLQDESISETTVYTKPLQLVFRSENGYVLFDGITNKVWSIPSSNVMGVILFNKDIIEEIHAALSKFKLIPIDSSEIILTHLTENFVVGNFKQEYFLAARGNEEWEILYAGNQVVDCQILDAHIFPVEWVKQCVDANGKVIDRP